MGPLKNIFQRRSSRANSYVEESDDTLAATAKENNAIGSGHYGTGSQTKFDRYDSTSTPLSATGVAQHNYSAVDTGVGGGGREGGGSGDSGRGRAAVATDPTERPPGFPGNDQHRQHRSDQSAAIAAAASASRSSLSVGRVRPAGGSFGGAGDGDGPGGPPPGHRDHGQDRGQSHAAAAASASAVPALAPAAPPHARHPLAHPLPPPHHHDTPPHHHHSPPNHHHHHQHHHNHHHSRSRSPSPIHQTHAYFSSSSPSVAVPASTAAPTAAATATTSAPAPTSTPASNNNNHHQQQHHHTPTKLHTAPPSFGRRGVDMSALPPLPSAKDSVNMLPDSLARAFHEVIRPYSDRIEHLEQQLADQENVIKVLKRERAEIHEWIDKRGLRPDVPISIASSMDASSPDAAATLNAQLDRKITIVNFDLHRLQDDLNDTISASHFAAAMAKFLPDVARLASLPSGPRFAFDLILKLGGNLNSHGGLADAAAAAATGDESAADDLNARHQFYAALDAAMVDVVRRRFADGESWSVQREIKRIEKTAAYLREYGIEPYFPATLETMHNGEKNGYGAPAPGSGQPTQPQRY